LKRRLLALSLLLAALLSLGWWIRELTAPAEIERQASVESPSAYAEQLTVHTFDTSGRLEQTLKTPHMEHYESRNTSDLSQPVLWRFDPDTPPWRMQAEQALAYNDEERIFLPGEVIIDRAATPQQPPYHIVTRNLNLETANAHATTEQPVLIESGQQQITAIGMEGWLKAPIKLNLLNQVRGYYEFD
jgi:lipopolysaccharide export system protein LptC